MFSAQYPKMYRESSLCEDEHLNRYQTLLSPPSSKLTLLYTFLYFTLLHLMVKNQRMKCKGVPDPI